MTSPTSPTVPVKLYETLWNSVQRIAKENGRDAVLMVNLAVAQCVYEATLASIGTKRIDEVMSKYDDESSYLDKLPIRDRLNAQGERIDR